MGIPSVREILSGDVALGSVTVRGWVRTARSSKKVSFIELSDGSTVHGLQLVISNDLPGAAEKLPRATTGAAITAEGLLVESPGKGQRYEVQVSAIEILGEADPELYPLQKKEHSLEFLREQLHLRPRSKTFGAVFRVRSAAAMAIHSFFQEQGFFYIHSPIITTSDGEGAGAMFRVTTLDLEKLPQKEGRTDVSQDFFGKTAGLTVTGQLEAEIFAEALSRVYTFGPTFRAENSNTTRHLAEFWMIEPEAAFFELRDNIELAQKCIRYLVRYLFEKCSDDLEFLHSREWVEPGLSELLRKLIDQQFTVIDYTEAVKILERSGRKFEFPVSWGIDLQSEHERYLTDEHVKGPVVVINYPKQIKAFYMKQNADERTVAAMDVLAPRLGEIIGGSQREDRLDLLRARMSELKLPEEPYWWYLELRRYGSVPHSGFGLGFERFLMYVTGMQNIRDVIPCPRYPGFAEF